MKRAFISTLAITALMTAVSPDAEAQNPRLELGRRLKRFENAWQSASETRRAGSVPPLKEAVSSFFSLRLAEAGRQLDNAWLTVRGDETADAFTRGVIGLQLVAGPVCAESKAGILKLELKAFYSTQAQAPAEAKVRFQLARSQGELIAETTFSIRELLEGVNWELGSIPEGDHVLSTTIKYDGSVFQIPPTTISRITQLEGRLKHVEDTAASLKSTAQSDADRTIAATLKDEARLIRNMARGRSQEADFPALHRLQTCEALMADRQAPTRLRDALKDFSEVWMTLARSRRTCRVRIQIPSQIDAPLPVLIVLHGAGGSENMFFETYGAGRVVQEATSRGWLVISPGQGLFGLPLDVDEIVRAVDPFVPVDRKRIMLMGHSMGASQVVRQVRKHPTLPVAAIALGGGGRMTSEDAGKSSSVPWFVAAGKEDFGLPGARQLHRDLTNAGNRSQYKVYQNIEHLVIVQASIDDTFSFLEATLADAE